MAKILFFFLIFFVYTSNAGSEVLSDENKPDVVMQDNELNEPSLVNTTVHFNERPDGHAPIGVIGDHVHKQGEFMVSFRLMMMRMEGVWSEDRGVKKVQKIIVQTIVFFILSKFLSQP